MNKIVWEIIAGIIVSLFADVILSIGVGLTEIIVTAIVSVITVAIL